MFLGWHTEYPMWKHVNTKQQLTTSLLYRGTARSTYSFIHHCRYIIIIITQRLVCLEQPTEFTQPLLFWFIRAHLVISFRPGVRAAFRWLNTSTRLCKQKWCACLYTWTAGEVRFHHKWSLSYSERSTCDQVSHDACWYRVWWGD